MRRHLPVTIEILLILLCFLAGSALLAYRPATPSDAPALLAPYESDQIIAGSWRLVGIGHPGGKPNALAIRLRSPEHSNPAIVFLKPLQPGQRCVGQCTRHFRLDTEFEMRDKYERADRPQSSGFPEDLARAVRILRERIAINDTSASPEELLHAAWTDIDVPGVSSVPNDGLVSLKLRLPVQEAAGRLLLLLGIGWLALLAATSHKRRLESLAVAGVLLGATLWRLPLLVAPFGADGPLQRMAYAAYPLQDILLALTPERFHPPLVLLILKASTALGGISECAARAPFFLAALIALPLAWALMRRLAGRVAAMGTLLILATHPAMLALSGAVNDFSLLLAFGMASALALAAFHDRPGSRRRALVVAMALLCIHASFLGPVFVFGLLVYRWTTRRSRPGRIGSRAGIVIALGALPILFLIGRAVVEAAAIKAGDAPASIAWGAQDPWLGLQAVARELFAWPLGAALLPLSLAGLGLALHRPIRRRRMLLVLWPFTGLLTVVLAMLFLLRARADYFHPLAVPLAMMAALFAAHAAHRIGARHFQAGRIVALLLIVCAMLPAIDRPFSPVRDIVEPEKSDLQNIVATLDAIDGTQRVAMPQNLGPLAAYYLCGRLALWRDREASPTHPCGPSRTLIDIGSPSDMLGLDPQSMDDHLARVTGRASFYLLLGPYASPALNTWSRRRCSSLVVGRDHSLLTCPALNP